MSSQGSHHGHSFQRGLFEGIQRNTSSVDSDGYFRS
jgi:hypothetical protein